MIARSFTASATASGAAAYAAFFESTLVPRLRRIAGHRGAIVLTRPDADRVHIHVLTFWESMEAVVRFAGDPPDRAVLEPEARAVLESWGERVAHLHVVVGSVP